MFDHCLSHDQHAPSSETRSCSQRATKHAGRRRSDGVTAGPLTRSNRAAWLVWSVWSVRFKQLVVGCSVLLLVGCPKTTEPVDTAPSEESIQRTANRRQANCERSLTGVFEALAPRRVDDDASINQAVSDLNLWRKSCGELTLDGGVDAVASDEPLRREKLPEEIAEQTVGPAFIEADAELIAEAVLARQIVDTVASESAVSSQSEAARALFDMTARQVMSTPGLGRSLPLPPRVLWQAGFAGARDRTRLLATLLRQRRIDAAVVAVPVPLEDGSTGGYEMLGVAVSDAPQFADDGTPTEDTGPGVLLFDPVGGIGFPSPSDPSQVATLDEALKNDAVFRQFDLGGNIHLATSESLAKRKIKFIGGAGLFAPRMGLLQLALPPSQPLELYDSLGQSELVAEQSGLIARLARTFDVPTERIEWWDGSITPGMDAISDQARDLMGRQVTQLLGPMKPSRVDDPTAPADAYELLPVRRPLRRGRIEQLTGVPQEASAVYLLSRVMADPLTENEAIPETIRDQAKAVNEASATDAQYWNALLQVDADKRDNAIKLLDRFLKQHGQSIWNVAARVEMARLLAETDRKPEAIAVMQTLGQQISPVDLWRLKQWGANVPTTQELLDEAARQQKTATGNAEPAGEKKQPGVEAASKPDEPKPDEPKADAPKADAPKVSDDAAEADPDSDTTEPVEETP